MGPNMKDEELSEYEDEELSEYEDEELSEYEDEDEDKELSKYYKLSKDEELSGKILVLIEHQHTRTGLPCENRMWYITTRGELLKRCTKCNKSLTRTHNRNWTAILGVRILKKHTKKKSEEITLIYYPNINLDDDDTQKKSYEGLRGLVGEEAKNKLTEADLTALTRVEDPQHMIQLVSLMDHLSMGSAASAAK